MRMASSIIINWTKEIITCVISNGDKIYSVNRSNSRCVKPHSHFRLIEFVQFSRAAAGDSTLGKDRQRDEKFVVVLLL